MTKIYDQHRAAFDNVSAYVVMKGKERLATIAFKFPRDGAGCLSVYVHWLGVEMVKGVAGGYGYDKRSAAMTDAARKMEFGDAVDQYGNDWAKEKRMFNKFVKAIALDSGSTWESELRNAGFTVFQAV